jgi:hypothetical protein
MTWCCTQELFIRSSYQQLTERPNGTRSHPARFLTFDASSRAASSTDAADEIKFLILLTDGFERAPYMRTTLANRRSWLEAPIGADVVFKFPERKKPTNWQW